jgi:hypothetical protein
MRKKIESDEIDTIEVFLNILNNKLKIAAITAIFIILSATQHFIFKPSINAKTKILPITIFEDNLYSSYNLFLETQTRGDIGEILSQSKLNKIDKDYLLDLFKEELQNKEIIIKAIKKYQLIDQSKFDDEDKYLKAVEKKASSLNLLRPVNVNGSKKGVTRLNWIIEFKTYDPKKWEEALIFIESEINNNIQKYLKQNFIITLDNLKLLEQFKIVDIDKMIDFEKKNFDKKMKKFEMDLEFKLVDIKVKINNAINDYEVETKNRLAFLNEQAAIARTLDIKKNTI